MPSEGKKSLTESMDQSKVDDSIEEFINPQEQNE